MKRWITILTENDDVGSETGLAEDAKPSAVNNALYNMVDAFN